MTTVRETNQVLAALVLAQKRAPAAVGKEDYNSFAHFDYVSADRMVIAGRQVLNECDLALAPIAQELREGFGAAPATMRTTYRLVHTSGEWLDFVFESPVVTKKGTPEDKGAFGACTESLGYMYRGLLSIGRVDPRDVPDVTSRDDRDYEPPRQSEPRRSDEGRRRDEEVSRQIDEALDGDDLPAWSRGSAGDDGAKDDGADQLADEFVKEIQRLGEAQPTTEVLGKLERLPPEIKGLNFPKPTYRRIVKIYNPIVAKVREALEVPA